MPGYDQPDTPCQPSYNPNGYPLSWFETNHPDWVEFKCPAGGLTESQPIADGDLADLASAQRPRPHSA